MLVQARDGNEGATAALLESERAGLLRMPECESRELGRAGLEAVDLVQETIIQAYKRFRQFTGKTHRQLLGWLHRIQQNAFRDRLRSGKRARRDFRRETPLGTIREQELPARRE